MDGTVKVLWAVYRSEIGGVRTILLVRRGGPISAASCLVTTFFPKQAGVGTDRGLGPVGAAALPSRHPARAIRATSS
jgi:hypothetical protein